MRKKKKAAKALKKTFLIPVITLLIIVVCVVLYSQDQKNSAGADLEKAQQLRVSEATEATVQATPTTEPAEIIETTVYTEPTEAPWSLPVPADIPAGEKEPGVTYRIVHEEVYAARKLYVRSGPGSAYDVIGFLTQGEPVKRGAVGDNGWSQILFRDQEAYVNTMHLSVTPVSLQSDEAASGVQFRDVDDIIYAIGTNKLRTGPGFEFPVIGHLVKGSGARRNAIGDNGWSRLIFHDTEAYACTAYLSQSRDSAQAAAVSPAYYEVEETVYAADVLNIRSGPGTDFEAVGQLSQGDPVSRVAVGEDGWSQILLGDETAYVCSAFLSRTPTALGDTVVTSEPELPTPNAPFLFQYCAPEGVMPYGLFFPSHQTDIESFPLIISLHGALEIGESPDTLKSNFLTKEFRNWEYTGLSGEDTYIVCPQLTGFGYSDSWSCPETAEKLFDLIDYLKENYNIDENRISIEGHSLGGQGALYMAAHPRACFSAVVLVSAYDPGVSFQHVDTAVRGYTGSPYLPSPREDWTSFNFMNEAFEKVFGLENWYIKSCSHYDIPMVALQQDADFDGHSDLIKWMISQYRE